MVQSLPKNLELIIRQQFFFRDSMGPPEDWFLQKKFLKSDLAENFIIDVARALESIVKFLWFSQPSLERYSLITF